MDTVILQCQVVTIIDFAEKGRKVIMTVSTTVKCDLSPESRERTRDVYETARIDIFASVKQEAEEGDFRLGRGTLVRPSSLQRR